MATNNTGGSTNTQNTEKKIAREDYKTIEPWQPMTQVVQPTHNDTKKKNGIAISEEEDEFNQ